MMEPTNESRPLEITGGNKSSVSRINPEDLILTPDSEDDAEDYGLSIDQSELEAPDHALRLASVKCDLAQLAMERGVADSFEQVDDQQFYEPVTLEEAPYLNKDIKTPTPLDPEHVYFGWYGEDGEFVGMSYQAHAMRWMIDRFNLSVAGLEAYGTQFPGTLYHAIHDEIVAQHGIRCEQNQTAYSRLLSAIAQNPSRLTPKLKELLPNYRSGTASTLNRIMLLLDFPEMRGIEDLKDTAIFDFPGFSKNIDDYMKSLIDLNGINGLRVLPRDNNLRGYQPKVVDLDGGIVIVKSVIADIGNGTQRLEAVERRSYCLLPADLKIDSETDSLVYGNNGRLYNLQLIAGSVYFRTAEAVLREDDPEDMSGMLIVNNPLGTGPTLSR